MEGHVMKIDYSFFRTEQLMDKLVIRGVGKTF